MQRVHGVRCVRGVLSVVLSVCVCVYWGGQGRARREKRGGNSYNKTPGKIYQTRRQEEAKHIVKVEWANAKRKEHWEYCQKTDSFFGTIEGPKTVIFPDAFFFFYFPWDLSTFSAESLLPNAQKGTF